MPRRDSAYGGDYPRRRAALLAGNPPCALRLAGCTGWATTADHQPPVSAFPPGQWRGRLVPACRSCNFRSGGWRLANAHRGVVRPLGPVVPPKASRRW